jgi:hypothetical protein
LYIKKDKAAEVGIAFCKLTDLAADAIKAAGLPLNLGSLSSSMPSTRTVVAGYLKRWSMEILLKDQKQHLGLGDYRVLRHQAIVGHLHLVDAAYACLTHIRMRLIIWQENVQGVIKYSHEKPVISRVEKLLAA